MASAAEQLAANINFGAFAKATELKKRIWFTLAALVIYRLGTYIPMPGIDPQVLEDLFRQNQGGVLGMFDLLAGGALRRMTIFALNIMPYISASIIIQLLTAVSSWMMIDAEMYGMMLSAKMVMRRSAPPASRSNMPSTPPWFWRKRSSNTCGSMPGIG